jgi:CxxC-x17-CxxC domain-containing protein
MSEDQILQCLDCGQDFVFSEKEQAFFEEKGFSTPKRCRECRTARRDRKKNDSGGDRRSGGGGSGRQQRSRGPKKPREMHDAICAECGIETQVPFKPREDKPVFCQDCFHPPR